MDAYMYYMLKRYGVTAVVTTVLSNVMDVETGIETPVTVSYTVRGPFVPLEMARERVAALLTAEVPYGGEYDRATALLLIDNAQLPEGYSIDLSSSVVIGTKRYKIRVLNPLMAKNYVEFVLTEDSPQVKGTV